MEGEVMEGFICPLCFKDLKTALNLNAHFQLHSLDEQKLFKSVKGLYEKAKNRITRNEVSSLQNEPDAAPSQRVPGYSASSTVPISSLAHRSHTDKFKALRDMRNERCATQTNTLLIRLGKLVNNMPSDPTRRKAYEQEVVPWFDDKDVPLCPGCGKSFSLLKRKHHCRLCGTIMCRNCTFVLSLEDARKMVGSTAVEKKKESSPLLSAQLAKIPQVQAVQAVLSLDGTVDGDLRMCEYCHRMLHARETTRQMRNERPIISQFYEKLRAKTAECEDAIKNYYTVYNSLCAGETRYTLDEAKTLRIELLRIADAVDSLSKKIATLGMNTASPPQGQALKLQQTIRNGVAQFLKKDVISLPSLPTPEEIVAFQERRRQIIERKIEEERQRELEEERRLAQEARELASQSRRVGVSSSSHNNSNMSSRHQNPPPTTSSGKVTMDEGWTPSVKAAIITDDPLLQQIGILHGFIEQAERAGKEDECAALKRNLVELKRALEEREEFNKNS